LDDEYQDNTLIIDNVYDYFNHKDDGDNNYNHTVSEIAQSRAQTLTLRNLENTPANVSQHTYTHTYVVTGVHVSPQLLHHNNAV
jgi:hypothetical protein